MSTFATVTIEGGLFPPDLVDRVATGDAPGQTSADFGLDSRRLTDEIQAAFSAARSYWDSFQQRRQRSRESLTTLTREYWVKPFFELLGFELQRLHSPLTVGNETFAISHRHGSTDDAPPVHIVSIEQDINRRDGRRSPHAMVQEYLNRSDALWGIVTNGRKLRLLRDSTRVSHPTFIEFDLPAMLEGNLYSDFVLLYRLLHATRLPGPEVETHECLLERYYQQGIDDGGRVRDHLRDSVEAALEELGTAFLKHPESLDLRAALESGRLDAPGYYRQLLRLIYRLLFLMVAEERRLLFGKDATAHQQVVYTQYYSLEALRNRAERPFNAEIEARNADLWHQLTRVFELFRDDDRARKLGLHALNGELFSVNACRDLERARCDNASLLRAMRELSVFRDEGVRRRINYAALDVEELGSVYESLLDFRPFVDLKNRSFQLRPGTERKTTGSYYTPKELVHELIKSALEPVMAERLKGTRTREEKEAALLGLRVIDPAAGSGHFLLAAARRIARELAQVRSGEQEPSPDEYRRALRDVIRQCIYAVDRNPLAVDLCKVALWIEGHEPGMPLSFLDAHIKLGDALIGVWDLGVLEEGVPDGAYEPVDGDEGPIAKAIRQRNEQERAGQLGFDMSSQTPIPSLAKEFSELSRFNEASVEDVRQKEQLYHRLRGKGSEWWHLKVACDLWTAAFFTPFTRANRELVPTTDTVRRFLRQPGASDGRLVGKAVALSTEHRFFHWPLEFPDVFEQGGFDVVLGNPPWEQLQLEETKFFRAAGAPEIAKLTGNRRKDAISRLPATNPALGQLWNQHVQEIRRLGRFVRKSGRFHLSATGKLNTYGLFAELSRTVKRSAGRLGIIVPTGIATDDTMKGFFTTVIDSGELCSLFDFENQGLFPEVVSLYKFCLLTLGPSDPRRKSSFGFFLHSVSELAEEDRVFQLTPTDFQLLNPNTRTCPIFRTRRDAEITKGIYQRVPILVREGDPNGNPWGVTFRQGLFNMTNASELFRFREELERDGWELRGNVFVKGGERYLPLYEGKMVHQFDHRWATYDSSTDSREMTEEEKRDPSCVALPRYWVPEREVEARLAGRWDRGWLIGWRDICRSTDERTVIAGVVGRGGTGHTFLLMMSSCDPKQVAGLLATLDSYVLDYAARQKVGGTHLKYHVFKQLPVLPPTTYGGFADEPEHRLTGDWIRARVLELTYTARDLAGLARDLGYDGPPFRWDPERRFLIRCELDAAFFHLYGITRDDVAYIMDTFPIVRRKDEATYGEFRTKRVILEMYDAMARAMAGGPPYQTPLDPPPGDPRAAHPA